MTLKKYFQPVCLKSISIDYNLLNYLKSLKGEIHSIFDNVFNIKTTENNIISIVSLRKKNGPNFILVDFSDFQKELIYIGCDVIGNSKKITIGKNLLIDISDTKMWKPNIKIKKDKGILKNNLLFLNSILESHFLDHYLQFRDRFLERINDFIMSINEKNKQKIYKSIKNLIGFGQGLTPSGDDFLVGFLSSFYFFELSDDLLILKNYIKSTIFDLKENTNFLSKKFLEYALFDRYSEIILDFLNTLYEDKDSIIISFNDLLKFGCTSGFDIIIGIINGINTIFLKK